MSFRALFDTVAAMFGYAKRDAPQPVAAQTRGTFTIGESTTRVTGLLTATGHVDYVAALNERLSAGVTSEDNANVAIWRILGPNPPSDGTEIPPGYFEKMGITPPPAEGHYYTGLQAYADRAVGPGGGKVALEILPRRVQRPWVASQSRGFVDWLDANAEPLDALRAAVEKPQYYNPLLPQQAEKGTWGVVYPGFAARREMASALTARAMLRLGQGDTAEAWQDLLACYRLGRQVRQGGTLLETLIGIAIEQVAFRGAAVFLDAAKPDAQALEGCLRDLFELPAGRPMGAQVELAERFWLLDYIMQIDRFGFSQVPTYDEDFKLVNNGIRDKALNGIDWDPALELANAKTDRLVAIFRVPNRAERVRRMVRLQAEARPHYTRFVRGKGGAALKAATTASDRGRVLGEMLCAGSLTMMGKVMDAADRIRQTFDVLTTAFAVAWHQRVNGRYPESLAELVPTVLESVPADVFSGKDLIYKPDANGFLLYGVGVNGIDDGGRWADDTPPGDDIAVRIPLPPKP